MTGSGGKSAPTPVDVLSGEGGRSSSAAAALAERVRELLDAAGHATVEVERAWIRFETVPDGGIRPVADVPIGRGCNLAVHGMGDGLTQSGDCAFDAFAAQLAEALPAIASASGSLLRRIRAVHRASWNASTAGEGEGRWLTSRVPTFAPIPLTKLGGPPMEDALRHAGCIVHVVGLGADLKGEEHHIEVGGAAQVATVLEPLLREQPERWRLKNRALAPGPRLEVDVVTVGLIEAAGKDPVEVLRRFSDDWQFSLPIAWNGERRTIFLTSEGKRVRSQQGLEHGSHRVYWSGGGIGVEKSRKKTKLACPGAAASVLTDHPAFRDRTIVQVETSDEPGSCWAELDLPLLSFDASAGSFRTYGRRSDEN